MIFSSITMFPDIVCEYKVEQHISKIAEWTIPQPTEEEIVRSFFKRGIAILDKGLASILKKHPLLSSDQ